MFEFLAIAGVGAVAAVGVWLFRHGKLVGVVQHIQTYGHEVPGLVSAAAAEAAKVEEAIKADLAKLRAKTVASVPVASLKDIVVEKPEPVPLPVVVAPPVVVDPVVAAPVAAAPYTGPYFRADGTPDPLGQYTADTLKRVQDQSSDAAHVYGGPISFADVTLDEALYLYKVATTYSSRYYAAISNVIALRLNGVHFAVLSGTRAQIAGVINLAGSTNAAAVSGYNVDAYAGRFKPLVEAVMAGTLQAV